MLSLEGKQLGNYDVIRRMRVGGMGAVYEGRQRTAFGRRVAIKVILGDYANDREMKRRFAREARTIARLQHPHILPLIEFGDEHGILYLVMPFIDGGTLTSYLHRSLPDLGGVAAIYQQLLDAVEYAHEQGLIHRDIKSSNVLLETRRSGPPHVYLADFGLVRTMRQIDNEQAGRPIPLDQVPGTPHYMAPEQTIGIVTPLTDIYALGVLLFQMLCGELPYDDPDDVQVIRMHLHSPIPSPCERDASIPSELGEVVRMAMAKRPELRYRSIADLRHAFLAAVKGPGTEEREPVETREEIEPEPEPEEKQKKDEKNIPAPLMIPHRSRKDGKDGREEKERERVEKGGAPVVIREWQVRRNGREGQERQGGRVERRGFAAQRVQRVTDDIKPVERVDRRVRITEEPAQSVNAVRIRAGRTAKKRLSLPWLVSVPLLLMALLLLTRMLGISPLPAGFPIFGPPPIAVISITPQSKTLQENFVLTASPQVKAPDLAARTIPASMVKKTVIDSKTVETTGTRSIGGSQARGVITLTNESNDPVELNAPFIISVDQTIQVRVSQGVQIGPHRKATVPAVAVLPGKAGNVPAHALDGPCCDGRLSVKNNEAFTGGEDGQILRIVTQEDVDGASKALTPVLQQRALDQIKKELGPDEVIAGAATYQVQVAASNTIGTQAEQVKVMVNIEASVAVYNRVIANQSAIQLLNKQAEQMLNAQYHPIATPIIIQPAEARPGKQGVVYLSIGVRGVWVYKITTLETGKWPQAIKGAIPEVAQAYLSAQPGVANVKIALPFGADRIPTAMEEIRITIVEITT